MLFLDFLCYKNKVTPKVETLIKIEFFDKLFRSCLLQALLAKCAGENGASCFLFQRDYTIGLAIGTLCTGTWAGV